MPFDALKVARDVHGALTQLGASLPAPQIMAADARRLAASSVGHLWRDREPVDFIQEFASRFVARALSSRPLGWELYMAVCFRAMG